MRILIRRILEESGGKAAYITLVSGAVIGLVMFLLDWYQIYTPNFMMTAFYLLILSLCYYVCRLKVYPEPLKEEARLLVWESWKEPLKSKTGKGLADYRVLSGLVLVTFIVLYYIFR